MVTITCKTKDCPQAEQELNFRGEPEFVICGECSAKIVGTDLRPDPEIPAEIED
jgi:hypothetical protein